MKLTGCAIGVGKTAAAMLVEAAGSRADSDPVKYNRQAMPASTPPPANRCGLQLWGGVSSLSSPNDPPVDTAP